MADGDISTASEAASLAGVKHDPLNDMPTIAERYPPGSKDWCHRNDRDADFPTLAGHYRVMVAGDSESIDGHTIYDYPDYETWAWFEPSEDGEGGNFTGTHDEENESIFAYFGPIHVPKFS